MERVEMNPIASIIIAEKNESENIEKCIMSILNQNEKKIELIIVDDNSKDDSVNVIKKYCKDRKIKLIQSRKNLGKSEARNLAISKAKANFIFFIDGDCIADKNWITEGLKLFKNEKISGIEGKVYYGSKNYNPTYSNRIVENTKGNEFMTCNMAYKKEALLENKFNPTFKKHQDRELALKIKRFGKIIFSSKMIVYHQPKKRGITDYLKEARDAEYKVMLIKKYPEERKELLFRTILYPKKLIATIFPPIIAYTLIKRRFKFLNDFKLIPFIYLKLIYSRYIIWKTAIKERVLVV